MSEWLKVEPTRHQVAIAGQVTDSQTGRALAGAQVWMIAAPAQFNHALALKALQYGDQWESTPGRPDRTLAARNGRFHFMDLPDGNYTLEAKLPGLGSRYGISKVKITVSRDDDGHINMAQAEIKLAPTTLKGQVTDETGPVAMAEVQVVGSGERAFSNEQGNYLLPGLEVGKNRKISISAKNYQPASQVVTFNAAGVVETLDFSLVKLRGEAAPA